LYYIYNAHARTRDAYAVINTLQVSNLYLYPITTRFTTYILPSTQNNPNKPPTINYLTNPNTTPNLQIYPSKIKQ